MSPPHPQLGPQAYTQGPLQLSQAQQIMEVASQNMLVVGNKLDRWWTATDAAGFIAVSFKPPDSELPIGGHSAPWFDVGEDDTSQFYLLGCWPYCVVCKVAELEWQR